MSETITTAWMWADENTGEVQGVTLNRKRGTLEWADGIGCACDDTNDEQPVADFLAKGPRYLTPPEDVLEEIRASVTAYLALAEPA